MAITYLNQVSWFVLPQKQTLTQELSVGSLRGNTDKEVKKMSLRRERCQKVSEVNNRSLLWATGTLFLWESSGKSCGIHLKSIP